MRRSSLRETTRPPLTTTRTRSPLLDLEQAPPHLRPQLRLGRGTYFSPPAIDCAFLAAQRGDVRIGIKATPSRGAFPGIQY